MLNIPRLSVEDADILIEAAERYADEIGVKFCFAVVDESGNLIAFRRMDGAKIMSVTLSQEKAMSAATSRKPTHIYGELNVEGSKTYGIQQAMGGHFSTVGGGFPVEIDGEIVGAMGCSGGAAEQDMECVLAAIDTFLDT